MKKFIMSFLVAGLVIISALSLNSCKKADTNGNTNMGASIPTVYDVITVEDAQHFSKDGREGEYIDCYYCPNFHFPEQTVNPYPDGRLYRCDHDIAYNEENHTFLCEVHSHIHFFTAEENCTPPHQTSPYFCIYKGLREHRHILTYTSLFFFNGWHIGGGADSE